MDARAWIALLLLAGALHAQERVAEVDDADGVPHLVPESEFVLIQGEGACPVDHYHAADGLSVIADDGVEIFDPDVVAPFDPCGFGPLVFFFPDAGGGNGGDAPPGADAPILGNGVDLSERGRFGPSSPPIGPTNGVNGFTDPAGLDPFTDAAMSDPNSDMTLVNYDPYGPEGFGPDPDDPTSAPNYDPYGSALIQALDHFGMSTVWVMTFSEKGGRVSYGPAFLIPAGSAACYFPGLNMLCFTAPEAESGSYKYFRFFAAGDFLHEYFHAYFDQIIEEGIDEKGSEVWKEGLKRAPGVTVKPTKPIGGKKEGTLTELGLDAADVLEEAWANFLEQAANQAVALLRSPGSFTAVKAQELWNGILNQPQIAYSNADSGNRFNYPLSQAEKGYLLHDILGLPDDVTKWKGVEWKK